MYIFWDVYYICIFSRMLCPIVNKQLEKNKETVIVASVNN